jgi:Putative Actinobacterial Holin-X, holin superfamily III
MQPAQTQRPLGELFSELATETGTLVRKEVQLATVEMTDKAKLAGRSAAIATGGGLVAGAGALALMAALILLLGTVIPLWASALLVGAIVTVAGVVLAMSGIRALKGIDAKPRQTIQTLEEDKRWLKEQVSR